MGSGSNLGGQQNYEINNPIMKLKSLTCLNYSQMQNLKKIISKLVSFKCLLSIVKQLSNAVKKKSRA